jgi:hypothetical protein
MKTLERRVSLSYLREGLMPSMIKRSFNAPEEIRHFDKGKVEVVHLGDVEVIRVTNQPGWRWSECVKPTMGTESCPVTHLINVISGRIMVRMDDGSQAEFGPGDIGFVPQVMMRGLLATKPL